MYPRNAATPPRIAIGAVVQISDGAVQTSGVSVVVRAEGGSESAGGGSTSYGASSGIVYYAPTQAETNYTAFVVVAYKAGCVPVAQTIITTESATPGRASADVTYWLGSAAPANTGDAYARLGAPAGASIAADLVTIASYVDTEIAALAAAVAALPDAAAVNAQVVDALRTDTGTELAAVPTAAPTLADAIQWLYQRMRNQETATATQQKVRNDAGTVIGTATITDDGTTFTRGKFA